MAKKQQINTQRILLFTLVAVSFFGFTLFMIQQAQSEEEATLGGTVLANKTNGNITLQSPARNAAIKSPVTISGQTKTTGATLQIKIKDASNITLAEKTVKAKESQKTASFAAQLAYKKPTRSTGVIEIFEKSTKDGSEINKVAVPITFKD